MSWIFSIVLAAVLLMGIMLLLSSTGPIAMAARIIFVLLWVIDAGATNESHYH